MFDHFWPWAARSAISKTASHWLDWLGFAGLSLLALCYGLFLILPQRYHVKIRPVVFCGALALLIQHHTQRNPIYVELLLFAYMGLSIMPHKWLISPGQWLRSKFSNTALRP